MSATPGPWTIRYETNVFGPDPRGGQRLVANTGGFSSGLDGVHEENVANARLIQMAPTLLTALKDALAELSPLMQAYRPHHYEAICGAAQAAITEAEGTS